MHVSDAEIKISCRYKPVQIIMVLNSKCVIRDNLIHFYSRLVGLKTEAPSAASTSTSTPQPVNNVVHYLASALLQIEQGIERRFLKAPLGKISKLKLHVSNFG